MVPGDAFITVLDQNKKDKLAVVYRILTEHGNQHRVRIIDISRCEEEKFIYKSFGNETLVEMENFQSKLARERQLYINLIEMEDDWPTEAHVEMDYEDFHL